MGWHIHCVENTVKVNCDIMQEIIDSSTEISDTWEDEGYNAQDESHRLGNLLPFDQDHMEHMDYVSDEVVQRILKRNKVAGTISFVSHDGDNAGQGWTYTFDGKGGLKVTRGPLKVSRSVAKKAKKR